MRGLVARVLVVAAAAWALAAPAGAATRPNILLVLTDDQRWDTVAYMPTVKSELAGRGVTFANAFAVNPLCCPSRASILTGQYSHSTGVYRNVAPWGGFASFQDERTIATALQASGYRTAYVGKYLNRYDGTYVPPGWDHWAAFTAGPEERLAYYDFELNVDGELEAYGSEPEDYSTDVLTEKALAFVRETASPFFLVYAPYAPHWPATPAPRHADAFATLEPWRPPSYDEADVSDKPRWLRAVPRWTPELRAVSDEARRGQLASLLAVDDGVRALLDALAESGRLERTVIVFTSDNGKLWGEHRWRKKEVPYEESIRVPLVVRYDALAPAKPVDPRFALNVDLAPTFAAAAGASLGGADGRSLLPLLRSPEAPSRARFLIEHVRLRGPPTYCAIRDRRWTYVAYATREEELYDVVADPYQLRNRANDRALEPTLAELRRSMLALCEPQPPRLDVRWVCTASGTSAPDRMAGTRRLDAFCGRAGDDELLGFGGGDRLRGNRDDDVLRGGRGDDRFFGGTGRDRIAGGRGNDRVWARDGERDVVGCGRGLDVVVADGFDVVAPDCERVTLGVAALAAPRAARARTTPRCSARERCYRRALQ